ncbi:60S acidic ribosomal protein P2 isoform X1 [Cephus cinctus]|uniref:Large ribosomal subunit protein P2 n=1 Tax=Cephus cinctus TaxID=211228 RepID=A0AAJ7CEB1_CEPCN|nr:60S acidic ribosomal protein P2 isoform X1 [Cephus cinctus]
MRYVAAYLLAVLGGKNAPNQTDIEKILSSVGIEADAEKLKKVISELNGKNIDELITKGREKLSSMPVGGGAAAPAAAAAAAAPVEEKKAEEKKPAKEESESEDDDMGFGLFD